MELRRLIGFVQRWLWPLALGVVLAGGVAFVVSRAQSRTYEATGTVLVNQAQSTGSVYTEVLANQQLAKTYSEMITSDPVRDRVAQKLAQDGVRTSGRPDISAGPRGTTTLVDITARDSDPSRAAATVNATAGVFADYLRQLQSTWQSNRQQQLTQQAAQLQRGMDESQQTIDSLDSPRPDMTDMDRFQQRVTAQLRIDTLRQSLVAVQRSIQDLQTDISGAADPVITVSPAAVPSAPVSPRVGLNTALGALLGLVVVAGVLAAVEYLDDAVRGPDEVRRMAGVASVVAVPRAGAALWPRDGRPQLLRGAAGRSAIADIQRMISAAFGPARREHASRTLLITSARDGEGKTTIAASLAAQIARSGRRVIVVDADLRRPALHAAFDIPNDVGLSSLWRTDAADVRTALRGGATPGLLVLTAGVSPTVSAGGPALPDPADVLASERMERLIEALRDQADVVLFDSPSVLSAPDASLLAGRVDGVVLVVEWGRTGVGDLARAVDLLHREATAVRLCGAVLNKLRGRLPAALLRTPDRYDGAYIVVPPSDLVAREPRPELVGTGADGHVTGRGNDRYPPMNSPRASRG